MAKVGKYVHVVKDATDVASVGTSYDAAKKHTINLNSVLGTYAKDNTGWSGVVEAVLVKFKSISGAASLTVRGMMDGETILPDTEADFNLDIGSTTEGSVVVLAGIAWNSRESSSIDIFYHTDAGTVTVDEVQVSWSE